MKRAITLLITLVVILAGKASPFAADDVVVRLAAKPESAWLGEKVVLTLDVLGKDGWAQLKRGHVRDVSGGYLKRYETQGTRIQETIEGSAYTGQQYEYLFFPQRSGEVTLAPAALEVEVKYWGAGTESVLTSASTPPLTLDIKVPPGLRADQAVVSTAELTAKQRWNPDTGELHVGDSVTRTITLEADGVSGMTFPPMAEQSLSGVGVYPASPKVEDSYSRGELTGMRVDEVVYVPEQGGEFGASELTFSWWNIEKERLESVSLAGKSFSVKAPAGVPAAAPTDSIDESRAGTRAIWSSGMVILIVLAVLLCAKPLAGRYKDWQKRRNNSEQVLFKRVGRAARDGDGLAVLNSSMYWLDRISTTDVSPRMDLFLSRFGEPEAVNRYLDFTNNLYSTNNISAVKGYYDALAKARLRWREAQRKNKKIDDVLPLVGIES